MKIKNNQTLLEYRLKIDELQEIFVEETNKLNNEYTPIYHVLKNKKNNYLYLVGWVICLLVVLTFSVFFDVIEPVYLIILLYTINIGLLVFTLILYLKIKKKFDIHLNEWNEKQKKLLVYQDEVNLYFDKAKEEVFKVICDTKYAEELKKLKQTVNNQEYEDNYLIKLNDVKKMIHQTLGDNYNNIDVLNYYDQWGKEITEGRISDYDFLAARKKKAELLSKYNNQKAEK